MVKLRNVLFTFFLIVPLVLISDESRVERKRLAELEQTLRDDIPHILCLERNFATGGQPSQSAYAKLAANGFRSVLNLRTAQEGVNLEEEKKAVEKAGMKYVNIPVVSIAPTSEQVTEFLKLMKDRAMQPVLIHCASANRVGAFWMIYRVLEQGWTQERAMQEATRIGLTNPGLRSFALDYLATQKR